ncbi:MAG: type IV pili methyl-accepting chemotaxis transducer N-terminal domain-containing protein [Pseudomonadota bacterium]
MKLVGLFAGLLSAGVTFGVVPIAVAEETSDAKARINLAGRQRMLSQKMAKASCFAMVDKGNFEHLTELKGAQETFDETLDGLVQGNEALSLNVEHHDTVLSALADVADLWAPFSAAVSDILGSGSVSETQLGVVSETNLPVLVRMNETVGIIEITYSDGGDVNPVRGRTINVAGRQRMLSQKMAKEFCMIAAGLNDAANRESLRSTMEQFETALTNLIAGADGLEVPNPAIGSRLERVNKIYAGVKEAYAKTLAGDAPTADELGTVANQSNRILREMNQIVFAYSVVD